MIKDLQTKFDILFTKRLSCYPPENEAAKLFAKFLSEHPEYDADEIDCRIESEKQEEDYYGNGGGYERTLVIYKRRLETQEEYNSRIKTEEDSIIKKFKSIFDGLVKGIKKNTEDLPSDQRVYGEIINHLQEFINTYNG